MNFTEKFRQAVENTKAFFKAAPIIIAEIKKDTEKEILRQKFHSACDNVIETHGDIIINVSKNVDIEKLASCAFDILALIEKWRIPIAEEGKKIAEVLNPIMETYDARSNKFGKEIANILLKMEKNNNWKERFFPDNTKLEQVKAKRKWDLEMKAFNEAHEFRDACTTTKVNIEELEAALHEEVKTFYIRNPKETVNEYWLRCKNGIKKFKTDKSKFTETIKAK